MQDSKLKMKLVFSYPSKPTATESGHQILPCIHIQYIRPPQIPLWTDWDPPCRPCPGHQIHFRIRPRRSAMTLWDEILPWLGLPRCLPRCPPWSASDWAIPHPPWPRRVFSGWGCEPSEDWATPTKSTTMTPFWRWHWRWRRWRRCRKRKKTEKGLHWTRRKRRCIPVWETQIGPVWGFVPGWAFRRSDTARAPAVSRPRWGSGWGEPAWPRPRRCTWIGVYFSGHWCPCPTARSPDWEPDFAAAAVGRTRNTPRE